MSPTSNAIPTDPPPASWSDLLSGRNALRSLTLAGGIGMHATNVYIVTTILPSVVKDIGGLEYYAWATSLFVVASIIAAGLASRLVEWLGYRSASLLALLVFSIGSAGCALAPHMVWLLLARTVQGFGGGVLVALSYAMIRVVFAPPLWSRAMALMSGMWGISTLSGPAIGGMFAQAGSWRGAFWFLLPAAAILALLVQFTLKIPAETRSEEKADSIPLTKILLLAAAVLSVSAASLFSSTVMNIVGIVFGIALIALIARLEQRPGARLLPSGAFSLRSRIGALYATMILMILGLTTEIYVPYFLQVIQGHSPLLAGYLTGIMSCGWTLAALLFSSYGGARARFVMKAGPLVVIAALLALSFMLPSAAVMDSYGLLPLCIALILVGFGIGMGMPHLMASILSSAHPDEGNLAAYSLTTVQLFATAIGAALAGMVTSLSGLADPGGLPGAENAAQWLFICFALAPLLAFFTVRQALRLKAPAAATPGAGQRMQHDQPLQEPLP
ncbi:MFS transporter [Collimonas pratensis]|uniref:Sugar (And other) transporter family protein n=1 Tax=Collimonas pratensis TaxID=279113 RepID=A0ABM5Z634_9BURK|nr:MFS transporter [Collimonas pratensis]AMP14523.1 sugar (and other) transporter family protein [Collimonas pratensis]NKI69188.1 MFS transporter [Collimonas pratensis]